jgi:hypothetical protein
MQKRKNRCGKLHLFLFEHLKLDIFKHWAVIREKELHIILKKLKRYFIYEGHREEKQAHYNSITFNLDYFSVSACPCKRESHKNLGDGC